MMKIEEIWADLESDRSFSGGLLYRRYDKTILPSFFIGISTAEKTRCIVVRVSGSFQFDFEYTDRLKDVSVDLKSDQVSPNSKLLVIALMNNNLRDIFSTVCEDLIESVSSISSEPLIAWELLNRLEKWVLLFDLANSEGLSDEAQRGLYGELYFLRKCLGKATDFGAVIKSWQGPGKSAKDFQFNDWAVEVKTTQGKNHQKIHVSNERQLDTSSVGSLYLYHISLNVLQSSGETLNSVVEEIREILNKDFRALTQFNSRLNLGGYFSHQTQLYNGVGFTIRAENFYRIEKEFPRVEENDLRNGVGDVTYSIILSNYSDYIIAEAELFKSITYNGDV